jgi:hypothetical protein
MPVNRTLNVGVTFNCTHDAGKGSFGGTATYAQTGCTPPDMGSLVDADGTIHLDRANTYDGTKYNQNVDIVMTLATPCTVTPDNTTLPVVWASVHGAGVTIKVPKTGSGTEFAVVPSARNPNVLTIQDKDDDANTYDYKPAVELPTIDNYYITLDPKIINRPTNK